MRIIIVKHTGLLIFCGKKSKISRDFQRQIRGKIGWFRGIFAGKKSKVAEKSADFTGKSQNSQKNRPMSREKSQNSQKNWPISRDFSGKNSKFVEKSADFARFSRESQITKDFPGQILRKIGRFHGKFRGKLRQETISKKQPISLFFFWQISLKSINFVSIWPALFNVFVNRDNHLLFQQQFAQEMSEC